VGGINFQIITYAARTEMVEYGRYFTPVSAELIGSKDTIWALIIRYYDLAYNDEKITVLMNPYNQLLKDFFKLPKGEKDSVLNNLLINQSVKETFLWLKKMNKANQRISLI
jgi:hypothetical protein